MRKQILMLSSLVLLAACSSEEPSVSNAPQSIRKEICYSTDIVTRATVTTINNIKSFNVTAYHQDAAGITKYIDNGAVNLQGGQWIPETKEYWPGSGLMRFYAYSPLADNVNCPTPASAIPQPTMEYDVPGFDNEQKDVLYAVTNCTELGSIAPDATEETVNLNFRHALSQIAINAENTNPKWIISIGTVTIHNLNHKGIYTFPTENTARGVETRGSWMSTDNDPRSFPFVFNEKKLDGVASEALASTDKKNTLLLMPQSKESWDFTNDPHCQNKGTYFSVELNVLKKNDDGSTTQLWPLGENYEIGAKARVAIPAKINWVEGKKYTYTLTFGEKEGIGRIPPEQSDGGKPAAGDDALRTIHYSVTVDDMPDGAIK